MKKTSILLDPLLHRGLARLAAEKGISKAEYIRRMLEYAVNASPRPRISAIGVGAGPGDVAENADRHLSETKFGDA
jgi:hypothetical protein